MTADKLLGRLALLNVLVANILQIGRRPLESCWQYLLTLHPNRVAVPRVNLSNCC